MRKEKKQAGITLIALAITIIILLILAGISIGVLTGENGLIKQSQSAKTQTEIAEEKEILDTATVKAMAKDRYGNLSQENLQESLDKIIGKGKTEVADAGENLEVCFWESKRYYEVDQDGNVGNYQEIIEDKSPGDITKDKEGNKLAGTQENPYEIWCVEDLVTFSAMVNGGYSDTNITISSYQFANNTVALMRDLNFKSKFSYADSTTTMYNGYLEIEDTTIPLIIGLTDTTKYKGFIPIGKQYVSGSSVYNFFGNFDGRGHTIKNLNENTTTWAGLFGEIRGDGKIYNLNVTGKIQTTSLAGGIVAVNRTGKIIINCKNFAEVISSSTAAGGIAGVNSGKIDKCYNYGNINGKGGTGGIAGQQYGGDSMEMTISNCINFGNIKNSTSYGAGGIVGFGYGNVINCYNAPNSQIEGINSSAGGIVGYTGKSNIYNCYNLGRIRSDYSLGGINGYTWTSAKINNCYSGNEIIGDKAGGIHGIVYIGGGTTIKNSFFLKSDYVTSGIANSSSDSIIGLTTLTQEIIDKLNTYIDTDPDAIGTTEWSKWKIDTEGNPEFVK